jgi:hypothetical protein
VRDRDAQPADSRSARHQIWIVRDPIEPRCHVSIIRARSDTRRSWRNVGAAGNGVLIGLYVREKVVEAPGVATS